MTDHVIRTILFQPSMDKWGPKTQAGSVAIVLDNSTTVFWGDVVMADQSEMTAAAAQHVATELAAILAGQSLDDMDLVAAVSDVEWTALALEARAIAELRLGVEQALVTAQAMVRRCTPAQVLSQVFAGAGSLSAVLPRLILEVDNHVATAATVQRMMALAPDGLGYRLAGGDIAESIGAQGQHLQRFVRELGMLLLGRDYPASSPPTIYLGLNGALGALTTDPWRELGRVLGHCTGLEKAAGALPLWLEDPVTIADEIVHAATLNQLRDYMRIRDMRTRIVGRKHSATPAGLQMLCDTDAIDGACLRPGEWGGLRGLFDAVRLLQSAEKLVVIDAGAATSLSRLSFLYDLATAVRADGILVGMGGGDGILAGEAVLLAGRSRGLSRFLSQSPL